MATGFTCTAILKDVVAYVDVWSSTKTDNYSKPFVQQLQEMGAQVAKAFNKQVTHVVFKNGHQATWKKAKKSGVKLVSVLWVDRCKNDGAHVDETLFPAFNDDCPALKKKQHRCMQPKDSPESTPENDRRMKRKLEKMIKALPVTSPSISEFSPYIIDEVNGIVYSPSMKRSHTMAKRLKEMKEKRENLSPTASQMVESRSSPELKPPPGSTLLDEQSDDECHTSFSAKSSEREDGYHKSQKKGLGKQHIESLHRKDSDKPWLSPCRDETKGRSVVHLNPPDLDLSINQTKEKGKSRGNLIKKDSIKKNKYQSPFESLCREDKSAGKNMESKKTGQSQLNFTFQKGKQLPNKVGQCETSAVQSLTESQFTHTAPINQKLSIGQTSSLHKTVLHTRKQRGPSLSVLVRSFTDKALSSLNAEEDDDEVFEDYFSPVNHHKRRRPLLTNLPIEAKINIPFELESSKGKRKQKNSDETMTESCSTKKKKKRKAQRATILSSSSDEHCDKVTPLPLSMENSCVAATRTSGRRTTLPMTNMAECSPQHVKQRTTSTFDDHDNSDSALSNATEGRGSEDIAAAGLTETVSEGIQSDTKQVHVCKKMDIKAKAMRTLVMTSMSTDKQNTVTQVVTKLGGFSVVDQVCESTTHVVSGGQRRTLNILLGIARGCWILSFEWILWCLEQGQWIPEEPYELSDDFPAAPICRLQQHLSAGEHQQDLFQDVPSIFVSHLCQPPTQSLVELIQLCGGTVCKTVRQAGICVGKYSGRRPEGSRILSEQWVLDCITHLKQLPYEHYNLE